MRRRNAMCHQLVMTSFAISACLLVNTAQAATRLPKSPWQSHASLKSSQVSPVYQQQWRQSDYVKRTLSSIEYQFRRDRELGS